MLCDSRGLAAAHAASPASQCRRCGAACRPCTASQARGQLPRHCGNAPCKHLCLQNRVVQMLPARQIPSPQLAGVPTPVAMCHAHLGGVSPPDVKPQLLSCPCMRRLHSLAHVELNAMELAWDTVARFSSHSMPQVCAHRSLSGNHKLGNLAPLALGMGAGLL